MNGSFEGGYFIRRRGPRCEFCGPRTNREPCRRQRTKIGPEIGIIGNLARLLRTGGLESERRLAVDV